MTVAVNDSAWEGLKAALARNANLKAIAAKDAVKSAEVIILAIPFRAVEAALQELASELDGKVLIDCTNPVGPGLTHNLNNTRSGAEMIQALLPGIAVVKAFSIYGFENFEDTAYPAYNVKPAMLFCGNNAGAKQIVAGLIEALSWQPLDVGGVEQALHLEHMTLLWVRVVRAYGHSANLVWAALER